MPAQIVILGASGDLTRRKLIPALASLARGQKLPTGLQIVGVSRREKSDEEFRAEMREFLEPEDAAAYDTLAPRIFYRSADVSERASLEALGAALDELQGEEGGRLFYLSLAPRLFETAVSNLDASGLLSRQARAKSAAFRRLVVEKPFGHDLESAKELNDVLHEHLEEEQVYRIDHYLGKETVQNLLGFRFHNAIFEPLWNRHNVELVQITVAESIGVEAGRAGYYDGVGAVRDMLQNHMLQVLSLVAMEPPTSMSPEDVRDQKVSVLRGLRAPGVEDVATDLVRARYAASERDGERLRGYADEEGVAADSDTETYIAVRAHIDTWRWSGVPFLLRHGKRLPRRFTEVKVQFRAAPLALFNRPAGIEDGELKRMIDRGELCVRRPNVLTLSIQPRERISLSFGVKEPGPEMNMAPAELEFDYEDRFGARSSSAYARLLLDALNGDPTLFLRADEIEASWRYVDQLRAAWTAGDAPLREYPACSWGPDEAEGLFHGCEGGWSRGEGSGT